MKLGAQDVVRRVRAAAESPERIELERSWYVGLAYYAGATGLRMDPRSGIPAQMSPAGTRPDDRRGANHVLVKVQKAISRIIALMPRFESPPLTASLDDLMAAELATKVFAHLRSVSGFDAGLRDVMLWSAICGSGFKRVRFDEQAGDRERIWLDQSGRPSIDAIASPELQRALEDRGQFSDVYSGEVRADALSPFHVKWEHTQARYVRDLPWIAFDYYVTPQSLTERFGERDWATEQGTQSKLWQDNIALMASPDSLTGHGSSFGAMPSQCRYIEYWERPLPSNQQRGRLVVSAGGIIVRDEPSPYAKAKVGLPVVKYDWFPAPGRFIGHSLVEQLRLPRKAYNRARKHTVDFMDTYGYPPVLVPKASGIKPISLQGFPRGVVWEFNSQGGQTPVFGQAPRLSEAAQLSIQQAKQELDEISANASPAKDAYPAQVRSGAAISLIQQDNNAILTPITHAMFESVAAEGELMLALAASFYSAPRMATVAGDIGEYEVFEFRGSDLRGHTQLRIRGNIGVLDSPEAYRQTILDSVSVGAFRPGENPRDRALFFSAMNIRSDLEIVDLETRQISRERATIRRIIKDTMYFPKLQPWEDPAARLPVLEHFLNSSTFDELDSLAQRKLVSRWQEMTAIVSARMQAQIQMQQKTAGTPGEKGQASQPAM